MDADEPTRAGHQHHQSRSPGGATEAYALLVFTMMCWGGNAVAGRLAVGEISPMVITSLRWAIVSIFLAGIKPRGLIQAWPELLRNRRKIVLMAICGFSLFNALFYLAAHYTTAVNMAILQGAIPVLVVIGAVVLHSTRVGSVQAFGIAATLIGVAIVASQGQLGTLTHLRFNVGDLLMLVACVLYAGYTLALRDRPNLPSLVFFSALAGVAFVTSLPLLAYEVVVGTAQWPTLEGWALLLFIALFPSFLAQLAFMRGVQLIGPGRAGVFANLAPIFGALFAVLILGEPFALSHLVALSLIVGGILVAEVAGRMQASAAAQPGLRRRRS
jgi:drug/metabolite transporter (DMT)-like permease